MWLYSFTPLSWTAEFAGSSQPSSLYILLPLNLEEQLSPHAELLRSVVAPRAL